MFNSIVYNSLGALFVTHLLYFVQFVVIAMVVYTVLDMGFHLIIRLFSLGKY